MDEYIKRDGLLRKFNVDDMMNVNGTLISLHDARETISNFPAADVSPLVHSYWEHKITYDEENIGICHNCKYPVSWFWKQSNYCPSCGAKMDGQRVEGEEND